MREEWVKVGVVVEMTRGSALRVVGRPLEADTELW